ncbi:hypothetical protein VNO78_34423 [Psophocarpus tetragonolobus]|uniref:Uncharacterized protein n=1 Tax=Psophocarpus tetragonolobus TaxID=3891 RepID=A0AAN9P232_PSOTE
MKSGVVGRFCLEGDLSSNEVFKLQADSLIFLFYWLQTLNGRSYETKTMLNAARHRKKSVTYLMQIISVSRFKFKYIIGLGVFSVLVLSLLYLVFVFSGCIGELLTVGTLLPLLIPNSVSLIDKPEGKFSVTVALICRLLPYAVSL